MTGHLSSHSYSMRVAAPTLLFLLLLEVCAASSDGTLSACPPCRGVSLAQGRPWRTFVPPAPNAPLTPCGCAAGASARQTSRSELREMSDASLEKMRAQISSKIAKHKSEHSADKDERSQMLANLRGRLESIEKKTDAQAADAERGHTDLADKHEASQTEVESVEAEITKIAAATEKDRLALRALRDRLSGAVAKAMTRCGNCRLQALSLISSRSTRSWRGAQDSFQSLSTVPVEHEQLVRKVEALEDEDARLQQAIADSAHEFGIAQRQLLDDIDAAKMELRHQDTNHAEVDHQLDAKTKRMQHQLKAATVFRDRQASDASSLQKALHSTEKKVGELEDAMRRCKCL